MNDSAIMAHCIKMDQFDMCVTFLMICLTSDDMTEGPYIDDLNPHLTMIFEGFLGTV